MLELATRLEAAGSWMSNDFGHISVLENHPKLPDSKGWGTSGWDHTFVASAHTLACCLADGLALNPMIFQIVSPDNSSVAQGGHSTQERRDRIYMFLP